MDSQPDLHADTSSPPEQPPVISADAPAGGLAVSAAAPSRSSDAWAQPLTRWLSLVAATAVVLYVCWLMLAPFLDVILWAVVLAVVFHPVHRRIALRIKSPNLAAAVSCLIVIVVIVVPLTFVTAAVVNDVTDMAKALQQHKDDWFRPDESSAVGRVLKWLGKYVDVDQARSREWLVERAKAVAGTIASSTLNFVGGTLGLVVQIFFVVFTLFYLFRDGPKLAAALRQVLPLDKPQARSVFQRTKDVITASVYGSVVIAIIQGILGGLAFWVLGLPSPLLWGAVMIVLCMIPLVGGTVVWLPAALFLFATGHWMKAVLLIGWGAGVIGTIDNVLRPYLVGNKTRMHELLVFFSVLGGLQLFGVLGIVTGPAVAAVAIALFEVWKEARNTSALRSGDSRADCGWP